jgi:hypothetical protein
MHHLGEDFKSLISYKLIQGLTRYKKGPLSENGFLLNITYLCTEFQSLMLKNTSWLLLVFCCISAISFADVGETYELRNKRQQLLQKLKSNDRNEVYLSENELVQKMKNYEQLIQIDDQIFQSYQATISRTINDEYGQKTDNRLLINLSFVFFLTLIISCAIIFRQNNLLKKYGFNQNPMVFLAREIKLVYLPLFKRNATAYHFNKLLYISVLVMAVFVFLGLLSYL